MLGMKLLTFSIFFLLLLIFPITSGQKPNENIFGSSWEHLNEETTKDNSQPLFNFGINNDHSLFKTHRGYSNANRRQDTMQFNDNNYRLSSLGNYGFGLSASSSVNNGGYKEFSPQTTNHNGGMFLKTSLQTDGSSQSISENGMSSSQLPSRNINLRPKTQFRNNRNSISSISKSVSVSAADGEPVISLPFQKNGEFDNFELTKPVKADEFKRFPASFDTVEQRSSSKMTEHETTSKNRANGANSEDKNHEKTKIENQRTESDDKSSVMKKETDSNVQKLEGNKQVTQDKLNAKSSQNKGTYNSSETTQDHESRNSKTTISKQASSSSGIHNNNESPVENEKSTEKPLIGNQTTATSSNQEPFRTTVSSIKNAKNEHSSKNSAGKMVSTNLNVTPETRTTAKI